MDSIIFDFDGTLVNTKPFIRKCYIDTTKKIDASLLDRANKILIGPTLKDTINEILGTKNKKLFNKFFKEFIHLHDNAVELNTLAFENVLNTLDLLKHKKIHMSIVTNKRKYPTNKIINYLGWSKYFEYILCSDSFSKTKSKTELIKYLLSKKEYYSTGLLLGDTTNDCYAANDNSIKFARAMWGYGENENWENKCINYSLININDLSNIF